MPLELWTAVLNTLADRRDVSLLVGVCIQPPTGLEVLTAGRVQALVSGFGLRRALDSGQIEFLPIRIGRMHSLLNGPLRPDVLLATVRPQGGGFTFTTEVSWQQASIAAGARVLGVVRPHAPACAPQAFVPLAADDVLLESEAAPLQLRYPPANDDQLAVAEQVARLLTDDVRVQIGPGSLGDAVYAAINRPVAVDSGGIPDAVVDLDRRGYLVGKPFAPYVMGTDIAHEWAPGRVELGGYEIAYDPGRLATGRPLVAINMCLEIDFDGQVSAEQVRGSAIGGIGGQPDYAAAAATSIRGTSVIALTTRQRGGASTLVERLSGPVTTPSHDVEIVATERGPADLRGLTRRERRATLQRLWDL